MAKTFQLQCTTILSQTYFQIISIESFQAEKDISDFYKDLDTPPEDYVSSKDNIPTWHWVSWRQHSSY